MATLYLTDQGLTVTKTGERFLVRKDGHLLHEVPALHVDQIVVFGNAHFTTPAVTFVLQQGIDVAYLSSHGTYRGRLQHAFAKDATLRQAQYQQASDPAFCLGLAKRLVHGKIHNARVFTRRQRRWDAEIRATTALLRRTLHQLEAAPSLDALRGYEGAAAAAAYRALRRLLKDDLGFQARVAHPPTDPVNVLLSLGATLLFNQTFAAINVVGLDPYMGFLHQTRHGHATLASDLMEEWRPLLVDAVVLGVLNRGELRAADFETREGRVQLRREGLARFLRAYDMRVRSEVHYPPTRQRLPYLRCIELQVRHVAQVLTARQPQYVPYTTR